MHYASVENLSKSFGIRTLFKNISFYVEEGDKIAFVARNGSGKSTLLKIIAGLDHADGGTVWVHKDIKVIMLQQDTPFEEEKSIWDNVLRMDNPVVKVVKAYEHFFFHYTQSDLLIVNTSEIDFVDRNEDLQELLKKVSAPIKGTQYFLPLGGEEAASA